MSENQHDKTEEPTAKKRREAQDDGKVPKSQELSAAAVLLGAGLMVGPGGSQIASAMRRLSQASFRGGPSSMSDPVLAVEWVRWVGMQAALGMLPFVLVVSALALAVGTVQGRGTLTAKPLEPDWSRLSPVKNLKRFASPRPIVDLLKSVTKVAVVALVVYVAMSGALEEMSRLPQSGPRALAETMRSEITRVMLSAGLALLAIAIADYGYQSWQYQRDLRMSKEEVKRELRESEGDPNIRARLRSLGRSLARMRMMQAVPTADVVVTNPTHIAVALKYDPEIAEAPIVVAMGSRKLAQRIRRTALQAGVPVIENKPVARALFAGARVGLPIPPMLYVAVAEILAFVFRHYRPARDRVSVRA
jgi:flagellar biosynthetic protein FlhB